MAANHEPSLAELKNNSERSRAELAMTVSKLRIKATDTAAEIKERVSVPHIKKEMSEHLRDTKDNLIQSLTEKARKNPLQAAAIGAGLAYPVWGLIRSIPLPLMLVGGGFWLASKSKQGTVESDLTARATEQAKVVAADAADMASRLQAQAAEGVNQVSRTVTEYTDAATAKAGALMDTAKAKASAAATATAAKANALMGDVSDYAADAKKAVTGAGQAALDTAAEATGMARDTISSTAVDGVAVGRRSTNALLDFVQRNPLLVAGSGLVLGAFVAASIPRTETEDRVLGQGTDFVKGKVREAAASGFDHVTRLATAAAGEAIASAAQQGLSGESLTTAVEGFTDSLKAVAKKAAKTALGDDQTITQNSTQPDIR
jgi:hypothetical protein